MSEPRARLGRSRQATKHEQDPEWRQKVDSLAESIFKRAVPRRVAEAVAADIVTGLHAGRDLADISAHADNNPEVYLIGVEEAEKWSGPARSKPNGTAISYNTSEAMAAVRAVSDDGTVEPLLGRWACSLIEARQDWLKRPRRDGG